MNINLLYPSKYVKAADLGDKLVTVTIKSAVMEELGYGAEKERKLVIYFEKATKGLILNRTNAMIIASMYTPETDNWLGSAIILYAIKVKAFGSWHDAVRVKEQIPPRNVGAAKMPEAMVDPPPIDDEDDLLDVDEGDDGPGAAAQAPTHVAQPQNVATSQESAPDDDLWEAEPSPGGSQTPPHQRMWGQGMAVFGTDWDMARPWVIGKWTARETPDNTRNSASELSDTEKDLLADYLKQKMNDLRRIWPRQKAVILQSTGTAVANGKVSVPA